MQIPESTIPTLKKLQANGHKIFLCSGRSRASIQAKELMDEIKLKGISKERMRKAGQFCVQVYCGEKSEFQKLYDAGIIRLVSDDVRDFYELTSMEYYSEEYGLVCLVDEGEAIFL